MATYNNIIHTVEILGNLFKDYPGRFDMQTELFERDYREIGARNRTSGAIVVLSYTPSMSVSTTQGVAFGQYFSSDLVKVNFDGLEYHLPDCAEFANWILVTGQMIRTYAEQDVWSL